MFSHPLDPPSVKAARATQLRHIQRWIKEASGLWPEQRARERWWQGQQQQRVRWGGISGSLTALLRQWNTRWERLLTS
jgi:hypothetical protein